MSYDARKAVLESIKYVDSVLSFDDTDGTARDLLAYCKKAIRVISLLLVTVETVPMHAISS